MARGLHCFGTIDEGWINSAEGKKKAWCGELKCAEADHNDFIKADLE